MVYEYYDIKKMSNQGTLQNSSSKKQWDNRVKDIFIKIFKLQHGVIEFIKRRMVYQTVELLMRDIFAVD